MAQIQGEIIIDRPVESVFDFVANETNEPLYNEEMLSAIQVTDGPIGVGTRFEAVMRQRNRQFPFTIEVTAFDRPHRLASHSFIEGMTMDGELSFAAVGDSTRMRWEWDVRPTGALRWLSPLVTWMGRRQEERIWSSLKQHLEMQNGDRLGRSTAGWES